MDRTLSDKPGSLSLRHIYFALYALCGLGMAMSAWLPYRVLSFGPTEITFSGMQFTENLAWVLVACGVGSTALGIVGLAGRQAPPYSVLLPPMTGLVFTGFFLLLFYQLGPTIANQKYVLVSDPHAWRMVKSQNPLPSLGMGLALTAITSLLMAGVTYPVFRMFHRRKKG